MPLDQPANVSRERHATQLRQHLELRFLEFAQSEIDLPWQVLESHAPSIGEVYTPVNTYFSRERLVQCCQGVAGEEF